MKQSFFVTSFVFIILLAACSGSEGDVSGLTEKERKQIESDVINRFNAMIKYSEAGELENIISHFDPAGPGSYIDEGKRYASLDEMLGLYRATWKVKSQSYGIPDTRVYVLSPRFAMVTSSSTLNTIDREGVVFHPRPWAITTLWTLNDGEWQIHSFQQFSGKAEPIEDEDDDEDEDD